MDSYDGQCYLLREQLSLIMLWQLAVPLSIFQLHMNSKALEDKGFAL